MGNVDALMQIVKLFIMIASGFILSKAGMLSSVMDKGISVIVVNLTWPCLIVVSLQREFSLDICKNMGLVAVMIAISIAIAYVSALVIRRVIKTDSKSMYLITFMMMFANTGFMGIPVCTSLFGTEGTFYAAIADAMSDAFIFTVGILILFKSKDASAKWQLKNLIEPATISIALGLILFVCQIRLPEILTSPMTTIGEATIPLSMIGIGSMLAKAKMSEMLGDYRLYIMSLFKLLIIPGIMFVGLKLAFGDLNIFLKVIILESAMP
ncbi:MAG: AEC family transporter, partial [Firmicutes bacterium]|nr:AEC family transporter [Bacillota bacterium]